MKNDQKNPIYPSVLFSCMIKQVKLMFQAEPVAKDTDTQPSPNNVQQYDACMKHGNMSVLG